MGSRPDYAALVVRAEKAVAGVKDPDLRSVAYQKILEDLLSANNTERPVARKTSRRSTGQESPNRSVTARKRQGPQSYVEELAADGFFRKPKAIAEVKAELGNRGHHLAVTSLSGPLQLLCQRRVLRPQKTASSGKKPTYSYSNW